ncbi:hypothetical protein, partial [methanotrophic endosymbiont of Bathymodiolus puteoserpentis (Logatchev)]|uniref:hypothetical protein n=1 Tax=methanotrophic endosymbiont of Bathymodiolus puteoserpentis (Logatchev) TaxID=343235 RepID=UPI001C2DC7CB
SFVASVNCLVAVYFTPMSCLNSTSVLLSVTFRGYALIIRIQVILLLTTVSLVTCQSLIEVSPFRTDSVEKQ